MLKGAFQIQTWPSSSFWNACWWLWHNPNVSGTHMCAFKKQEQLLVYCRFNDFKDLIYTSFFLYIFWFQLIRAILENPKDKTNVHLIYANVTLDDILLKVICLIYSFFFFFLFSFFWDEL
jgi:hypothetical protein